MGRKPFSSPEWAKITLFPTMILVSTYTGYTGSGTNATDPGAKRSKIFPKSDFAPSEMNISSNSKSTEKFL